MMKAETRLECEEKKTLGEKTLKKLASEEKIRQWLDCCFL